MDMSSQTTCLQAGLRVLASLRCASDADGGAGSIAHRNTEEAGTASRPDRRTSPIERANDCKLTDSMQGITLWRKAPPIPTHRQPELAPGPEKDRFQGCGARFPQRLPSLSPPSG